MWNVIVTFAAAALVIYLSYIASRYIGKGLGKSTSSRYMRLIDQITLGQDRYIGIVQVSGKYLLVGITAGQIRILSEMTEDELYPLEPESVSADARTPDFRALMDRFGDMGKKRR